MFPISRISQVGFAILATVLRNSSCNMETKMTQLIFDKISVPAELPTISRPRLLNRLKASLTACNMTIINGRAGTGKTLLAADFARCCGRRIVWYKIDASDSDPKVFADYFVNGIRRHRSGFTEKWDSGYLQNLSAEEMKNLALALVYELSERAGEPLLIVVDDLHLIYDAQWVVPFFSRLAPLLPADTHLLILGRILPPAPLWRMRSKQTLSIIDETSLGFTLEETKHLLKNYGLGESCAKDFFQMSRGRASKLDELVKAHRVSMCLRPAQPYVSAL